MKHMGHACCIYGYCTCCNKRLHLAAAELARAQPVLEQLMSTVV